MRIVHLTWGLRTGGSETMLVDLLREQAGEHSVALVIGNDDIDTDVFRELPDNIRTIRLDRALGSRNPWHLLKLALLIRRLRPDVVHAHQESFGRLRSTVGRPMVLTVHNTRLPLKHGFASFDSVCCISEAVAADVRSRSATQVNAVIPNGVRFERIRLKEGYGGGSLRVVQVGRLAHEQKGQDVLLHALGMLRDKRPAVDVSVDFIGEGDSREYLEALARDLGVATQCRFPGAWPRERLYSTLHQYDALLLPSRYEGFGLVILEGLAAGLPVAVADIDGPREIIRAEDLGWTFRAGDADHLAGVLLEIASATNEPTFGEEMRRRRDRAAARYSIRSTAKSYLDEYARLASGST